MAHKCDGCRYKGENQEMMFRPMGVCTRGANLDEAVRNYDAEKCPYEKTNADRIRAMTDKEIAKLLVDAVSIGCPFKMDWSCEKEKDGWDACDACWCKWLKQPAE